MRDEIIRALKLAAFTLPQYEEDAFTDEELKKMIELADDIIDIIDRRGK